jgi:hypothetical protein
MAILFALVLKAISERAIVFPVVPVMIRTQLFIFLDIIN